MIARGEVLSYAAVVAFQRPRVYIPDPVCVQWQFPLMVEYERLNKPHDRCRAIFLDPTFKRAWMRRGMVRHSRGKYAGAVDDFSEALLLDPNDKHAKKLKEHSAAKVCEVRLTSLTFLTILFRS